MAQSHACRQLPDLTNRTVNLYGLILAAFANVVKAATRHGEADAPLNGSQKVGNRMADSAQDMARSVAETMIGNCGFSQGLGMRIADAGPDFAVIEMELTALHMNGHAICHGGAIFAMADTAFAHACNSDNVVTVAQQCQVNFLKSARLGDTLRATAALRGLSGRTGLYDVAITDQHEVLIAEFRGMSRKLSGPVVPPDGGALAV